MCHLCMTFTYIIIIFQILSLVSLLELWSLLYYLWLGTFFLTTMYLTYAIIHPLHIQLFNLNTIFIIHFLFVIQFSFLYDISPFGYNTRYHIATTPDYASEQLWVDLWNILLIKLNKQFHYWGTKPISVIKQLYKNYRPVAQDINLAIRRHSNYINRSTTSATVPRW